MKYCAEVAAELGLEVLPGLLPRECCDSCHEDQAEYGEPMMLSEDDEICCAISRLREERQLNQRAP